MTTQCPQRRISNIAELQSQLTAWESIRNANTKSVDWQFTAHDARIKLKSLYPKF